MPPSPLKLAWLYSPGVDKGAILVYAVEAGANVPRCRVVKKVAAFPASAPETDAAVAEAVINSAVESDVWSPVTRMPTVNAARESPVAGRPQHTRCGGATHTPGIQ